MTKKLLRSMMIGFCVFITTIIIAYISFMYAYRFSVERTTEALSPETSALAETLVPLSPNDVIKIEHYLARYTGDSLAIYAVCEDKEEFLYTLDARIEDISTEELNELKEGIILPDKQALASFEEDFTS